MITSNKVSVIIPTYNRFRHLLNAIESVKNQTHKDIEIIVVNDRSSQEDYYQYDFPSVNIVHLDKNAVERHGRKYPGCYPRNVGIRIAMGDYIAFLDDDDIWLPNKIELQLQAMRYNGCQMSCTDGYIGKGFYNKYGKYYRYNGEYYRNKIESIFNRKGKASLFPVSDTDTGFPKIWDYNFLKVHNCCVTSSVILSRLVVAKIGGFKLMPKSEDYNYWLRALHRTDCVYLEEPCFYYDQAHAGGNHF